MRTQLMDYRLHKAADLPSGLSRIRSPLLTAVLLQSTDGMPVTEYVVVADGETGMLLPVWPVLH